MEKKIAVLSDAGGAPTTLTRAESVILYERLENDWQEILNVSCTGFAVDTPGDLRMLGEALADQLCDSKVILGSDISGASYSALNRVGFMICESEGISDEFFDELFEELEADEDVRTVEKADSINDAEREASAKTLTAPQPSALPGHYFINLKEVQQCNPMLSTKKILRPFLSGTLFVELVMLCDHEPPWLGTDLPQMGLCMTCRQTDTNTFMVTITHKACT